MAAVYSGATTMREQFSEWYLDYRNNFTSVLGFADYYGITLDQANQVIEIGRVIHHSPHPES